LDAKNGKPCAFLPGDWRAVMAPDGVPAWESWSPHPTAPNRVHTRTHSPAPALSVDCGWLMVESKKASFSPQTICDLRFQICDCKTPTIHVALS